MYFSTYILGKGTPAIGDKNSVVDGQTPAQGASMLTYSDENGKWETTEQYNVALDWAMLRNRLTGTIDLFRRDTKKMFLTIDAPAYAGNRFPARVNVGTVRNDGLELTLNYLNTVGKVDFSVGGNVSFIKNELVGLNGGEPVFDYTNHTISDKGLALFTFFGYEYLGLYQTQDEIDKYLYDTASGTYQVGDAKYKDENGDGKINDEDRMPLGNPFPWLSYGLNANVAYAGFDLQCLLQGVYGNKIYNALREKLEGPGNETIMSTDMRNCWTSSNPDGVIPNPRNSVNFFASSRFIENGAYLRLKNLQLGYTLPKALTKKVSIDRMRLYASVSNLFTLTKYKGYDPEVGSGTDFGNYPQARTFMFGVNLDF
ncbi:hypothetical protein FACS189413_14590 [Bacteroidia bacterium]|nr:hypothetical protein FACS189413_14590 [Bacteroidia bacterium]